MSVLIWAIVAYLLYLFIFKLVIPVYMASRKIKKGFREMHNRMEQQMNQQKSSAQQSTAPNTGKKPKAGDYIEFEEVN